MKNKVIGSLFFEEPTVTGNTFLAMMKNIPLCHVPVGTVFLLDGALPHFSHHVHAFINREFPELLDRKAGSNYSLVLSFFRFDSCGFVRDTVHCEKVQNA
jgi:hypothetical protein